MANPWVSMWLGAANGWLGLAKGIATAESRRRQRGVLRDMTRQTMQLWQETLTGRRAPASGRTPRRERRSGTS